MKPFFSLIIPCYNVIQFINQGFETLVNQTFKDFEVILIDDCSTDDTYNFLSNYKAKSSLNITLIKNEKNCGPGQSRNNGINIAKGEYITFMDSDDWLEYTFFEEMYNSIINDNADMVQCDFYRYYNGRKHWIKCTQNLEATSSKSEILAKSVSSLCNLAIKKEIFQNLSIPSLYNAEDVIIIPQLFSKAKSVSFVHKPLYVYQYRPVSLSKRKDEKVVTSFINGFYELRKNIPQTYTDAIEFIGIKMVLYGATFNAMRINMNKQQIIQTIENFINEYPNCLNNIYLKTLPLRKRFYIKSTFYKQYWILFLYSKLHHLMLNS